MNGYSIRCAVAVVGVCGMLSAGCCGPEQHCPADIAPAPAAEAVKKTIQESPRLQEFDRLLQEYRAEIYERAGKGLTAERIASLADTAGVKIPAAVAAFYQRYDGGLEFFGILSMPSLEKALTQRPQGTEDILVFGEYGGSGCFYRSGDDRVWLVFPDENRRIEFADFNVFLQAMNAMLDQGVDQLDTDIAIETTDGIWSEFGRESQLNAQ